MASAQHNAVFSIAVCVSVPTAAAADVGMFGARLFVMSAFTLMWVFTPELFPTHVRALALGINNASARLVDTTSSA